MTDTPRFDPTAHQVWVGRGNLGYRRSIETAGTVAAPLLAGFSFTLLVLLLPTLSEKTTTVRAGTDVRVITESQAFSATPEIAGILLLLAGLFLVAAVQAALAVRFHAHTPADYEEWYPQYFRDLASGEEPPDDLKGWSWEGATPVSVGTKWYGGWPRKRLFEQVVLANKWAGRMHWFYRAGIMSLLLGLTFLVLPPEGDQTFLRWLLFAVAVAGVLAETTWILANQFEDELAAMRERRRNPPIRSHRS